MDSTKTAMEVTKAIERIKVLYKIIDEKDNKEETEYEELIDYVKNELIQNDPNVSPLVMRRELLYHEIDAVDAEITRIEAQLIVPRERKKRLENDLKSIKYILREREGELFRDAMLNNNT